MRTSLAYGVVLVVLSLAVPARAERQAELSIVFEQTCVFPTGIFANTGTTIFTFALPDDSGAVSAEAKTELTGAGSPATGNSGMEGRVENDAELILTKMVTTWPYGGPNVQEGELAKIPLEPDTVVEIPYEVTDIPDVYCSGTTRYALTFSRDRQHWSVDLLGVYRHINMADYPAFVPEREQWIWLHHEFGFAFTYRLGVDVTLIRRKGDWVLEQAKVARADVKADYEQSPDLYRVVARGCPGCASVAGLAGKLLSGEVSDGVLQLKWPDLRPEATISAVFAYQCAPGEFQAECERHRQRESSYTDADNRFFLEAASQLVPLSAGTHTFEKAFAQSLVVREDLKQQYELRKLD